MSSVCECMQSNRRCVGLAALVRASLTFFLSPLVPGFCPSKGFVWTSRADMLGWGVMLVLTGSALDKCTMCISVKPKSGLDHETEKIH